LDSAKLLCLKLSYAWATGSLNRSRCSHRQRACDRKQACLLLWRHKVMPHSWAEDSSVEDNHNLVAADSHKLLVVDNCMGVLVVDSSHAVGVDTWGLEVDSYKRMDFPVAVRHSRPDHNILDGYRKSHTAKKAHPSAAYRRVSRSDPPAGQNVYPWRLSPAASPSLFHPPFSFSGSSVLLCRTCDSAHSLSHCGIPAASRTMRMACTHRSRAEKNRLTR